MPKPIKIVSTLLLFLCVIFGLLAANPGLLLSPLLQSQLAKADFRLVALESIQAGLQSASADSLIAESATLKVSAQSIQVGYSLSGLLNGEITAIEIGTLELQLLEDSDGSGNEELNPRELYQSIADLPIGTITINEARIGSPLGDLDVDLDFQTSPVRLSLSGQWLGAETLDFTLDAETAADNRILASSAVSQDDRLLFEGRQEVALIDSGLVASGQLSIDANSLQQAVLPTGQQDTSWTILNNNLQLEYRIALNTVSTAARIESLLVTVDGGQEAGSTDLQVQAETDNARYLAQLGLPMTLSMTPDTSNELYQAVLTDSYHNLSWSSDEYQVHTEANLSNFRVNCESWNHCLGSVNFQLHSPAWEFSGASGEGARLSGNLDIEKLQDLVEIRGNNLAMTFDAARYAQWYGAGDFEIEQLLLIPGELDRGRIRLRSNNLSIDSDSLDLVDPWIAANINLVDDGLAGSIEMSLGASGDLDAPILQGSLNHSLSSGDGGMALSLNETTFSESEPLSALVRQQWLNMDVAAGTVSGSAQLQWSALDEDLQLSGPASIYLDALSGHVEDTLLVGVSTEAQGEFLNWNELISAPDLTASIEMIDIGLPTRNVQWQYSFNTLEREILISELNSELFGGKVEVADFRLDPDNLDQDLTLVLSRLNLESIVELAGYPQLFVDGLISGYLPITLANGQILVHEGLVGALRPGGNIRYTPVNSAAVNQTMELVNEALSNYQYETLDTRVFYDENGDLRMEVQLQGINPDMNGGQPINLNVNVTDNIPSLLQSLKAGQEISERLEQRLQNR